jgi:hypothetical protein
MKITKLYNVTADKPLDSQSTLTSTDSMSISDKQTEDN